ncbi:Nin one binding Zn-ribbon like-domain-containing protein, partial [Dimargaris cristalligena]
KPFVSLVLDASPLFQSLEGISRLADKFYTVPEVVQEIRSSKHREQLANNIYFDLQVREPSAVDMKAVVEFAKKTGDYASLSAPDMKILALTYALEREAKGIDHLHTEPASARGEDTSAEPLSVDSDAVTEQMQSLSLNKADKPKAPARAPVDFDDGWITPSNVAKKNAEFGFNRVVDSSQDKIAVACATGDFAVQNVILQIGLNLADFNGSLIKKVQTSVLRCYSCYHIMTRTDRKFCSECGHSTITRVSASVGEDGELQVHLSKHYKLNLRGTRYSMPKPKGGHKHTNLVVREDQKEYRRGIRAAKARAKNNGPGVFDVDYIP